MGGDLFGLVDDEETVAAIRRQVRKQFRVCVVVVGVVSLVVGGLIGAFTTRGRALLGAAPLTPPPYWDVVRTPDAGAPASVPDATVTPPPVRVYVTGGVAQPGVVTVPAGSLLADALDAAGGATSDADLERVNLAAPLADNQHVIIPTRTAEDVTGTSPPVGAGTLVNINTATQAELETLPHIGPAMAQRIIAYREENGPFTAKEDLQNVAGIGEARYNDIEPLITVDVEP